MLSSTEGAVAIWRPDQCYQPPSGTIMHIEASCAIWCLYLPQQVNPTHPDSAVCRLLPHFFFEIVDIRPLKASCLRNGLECGLAGGASLMVSGVKDRRVSKLVSTNSECIVT